MRSCSSITFRILAVAVVMPLQPMAEARSEPSKEEIEKRANGRIVGGNPTTIERHPHQVAITLKSMIAGGVKSAWCGGSIIDKRWVVTAAHCLFFQGQRIPDSEFMVKIGATNVATDSTWRPIERAVAHGCYNPEGNGKDPDDIAMMRLSINAASSRVIDMASQTTSTRPGADTVVTGWGAVTEGGPSPAVLREVTVPIVTKQVCMTDKTGYAPFIKDTMICAGYEKGGKDSCNGDSGGPMVLASGQKRTLLGVVSWGEGCARAQGYGVYTRIASYRTWISDVMKGKTSACPKS